MTELSARSIFEYKTNKSANRLAGLLRFVIINGKYFDVMNETLAYLHLTDCASIGLADYGRPGNHLECQIKRWSEQYLQCRDQKFNFNSKTLDRFLEA